jgi:hypothetical protein
MRGARIGVADAILLEKQSAFLRKAEVVLTTAGVAEGWRWSTFGRRNGTAKASTCR